MSNGAPYAWNSPALPAEYLDIVQQGLHRLDQEGQHKPYKAAIDADVRELILQHIASCATIHCAGIADGWPFGFAAPLTYIRGDNARPVLFLAMPCTSADLERIRADGRVSGATYYATGFENRREAKSLQIQGMATVIDLPSAVADIIGRITHDLALLPEGALDADSAAVVRIDVLSAVFFNASGRPMWGLMDYFPSGVD